LINDTAGTLRAVEGNAGKSSQSLKDFINDVTRFGALKA